MHVQRHFDRDIEEIKTMLLRMGAMVEESMQQSIRALLDLDLAIAEQVIANDDRIDQMEVQIDQHVIELIAKMQPAAGDLRFVATVMKIVFVSAYSLTRPSMKKAVRSETRAACCMLWVTMTIV